MDLGAAIGPTPIVVSPETAVLVAIAAMQPVARSLGSGDRQARWESSANCVLVVQGGQVVGLLTASDVVRLTAAQHPLATTAIAAVMSQPVVTLVQTPTTTVADAVTLLRRYSIRHLPVVDAQGDLVGLVTQDSIFALLELAPAAEPSAPATSTASVSPALVAAVQTSQHHLIDILNHTQAAICSFRLYPDSTYEYDYYSQGSELIYGYGPQVLKHQLGLWRSRIHPDDLETVILPAQKAIYTGETRLDLEFRFYHGDGSLRWIGERCTARWDEFQRCWLVTTIAVDISDRKRAEIALQASEARFRAVVEQAAVGINQADVTGRYIQANQYFCDLLGYSLEELLTLRYQDLNHPDDVTQGLILQARRFKGELSCPTVERRYRHKSGEWIWTELTLSLIRDEAGEVISDLAIVVDIRDRKRAELALRQSEAKSRAVLSALPDLMFRLGADGRYREVINPRPDLELFFNGQNPIGHHLSEFAPEAIAARKLRTLRKVLATGKLRLYEQKIETPTGCRYEEVRVVKSDDDEVLFLIRDISDRRQAEAQIIHNSLHDPLTGLPNRTLLSDRLTAAIHRAQHQPGYQYAVLFLDLDRFKVINDSLGHCVGDQLLIAIAHTLQTHLRPGDVAARLGGDEFVLLLEDIDNPDKAVAVAEQVLADCHTPMVLDGHEVVTGGSIGIAMGKARYTQAADLIRDADIAMYRAKHRQRGTYQFFDPAMHTQVLAQHTLEVELYRAIEQQELTLYYQPVIDLAQGRLAGFEALVRWLHPSRGLLSPDVFLPCAEATGLIVPLDHWVLRQTCQQLKRWQHQFPHHGPLKVSVNLSAQNFASASLLDDVAAILAETALPGPCLNLEITENMLIKDMEKAVYLLTQLAERGICISVDDFGMGHSSLQYLHRFSLSHLKIDRSFVKHLDSDNRDYAMVQMILSLSQQLGLATIAEGIETPQQLHLLKQLGCQFAQGYLFAKPLPLDAAEAYLARESSAPLGNLDLQKPIR